MRQEVPNHLQKDFLSLTSLSYDHEKRHPDLKRNVKFDEDDRGLFMDIKLKGDSDWRRVKPEQAATANKRRKRNATQEIRNDELQILLGGSDCE